MKKPLFEVGETVLIYRTLAEPRVHGYETVVKSRIYREGGYDKFTGRHKGPGYRYYVDPCPVDIGIPWNEPCLRKKYESGQSFESLMQELKGPVKA